MPDSATTGEGVKLSELPIPVRQYYTFDGWYTAKIDGEEVDVNTVYTQNTTLYAHWTQKPIYTVSFDANGGSGSMAAVNVVSGNSYTLPGCGLPPPEGQQFAGWATSATGTVIPGPASTVTVSPKAPKKDDTVAITPKPEAGYTVEQILVTDKNGDAVKVTNNGDGTYSFTQPAGKVTVEVTFMEDNTMLNFFVDVPADAYYYDAVLWAAENGITGGTNAEGTTFSPDFDCTRAQIVTFLFRCLG